MARFSIASPSFGRFVRSTAFTIPLACIIGLATAKVRPGDELATTPMHVAKMAAMRFMYSESKMTFAKMQGPELAQMIDKARTAAAGNISGNLCFSYVGASGDMTKEFTLKVGYPVKPGTVAPDGFTVVDVPEYKCATLVMFGPMSNMGKAYETLYSELLQNGLVPSGDSREYYLYWEGPQSENDVTLLQVGVK